MSNKSFQNAIGVFSKLEKAEQALNELKASGLSIEKVSIIAKDVDQGQQVGIVQTSDRIGNQNVDITGAVRVFGYLQRSMSMSAYEWLGKIHSHLLH
ncbi:hypothetical protein [Fischerella sp. JS2]|uniref:hypothetical protein n=1 Tax=Fischerella sp. JS2 TaxID=2597771 RepID=UPI0028EE00BB|nr:hypothetical protein [Fischerella sp. JS2]